MKVSDFGFTRIVERDHAVIRQIYVGMGNVAYMAPELYTRSDWPPARRRDIYALGIIFYELLDAEAAGPPLADAVADQRHAAARHRRHLRSHDARRREPSATRRSTTSSTTSTSSRAWTTLLGRQNQVLVGESPLSAIKFRAGAEEPLAGTPVEGDDDDDKKAAAATARTRSSSAARRSSDAAKATGALAATTRPFAQEQHARAVIEQVTRAGTRADRNATHDRADDRGRDRTADRDWQKQAEQQSTDKDRDWWREDHLRRASRRRFILPVAFTTFAALAARQCMLRTTRRCTPTAPHDRCRQAVAARRGTRSHMNILPPFPTRASVGSQAGRCAGDALLRPCRCPDRVWRWRPCAFERREPRRIVWRRGVAPFRRRQDVMSIAYERVKTRNRAYARPSSDRSSARPRSRSRPGREAS